MTLNLAILWLLEQSIKKIKKKTNSVIKAVIYVAKRTYIYMKNRSFKQIMVFLSTLK